MSKVFVSMGMSLDGFIAGTNRGPKNPMGGRSMDIHEWVFPTKAFREALRIGQGGETGAENVRVEATFNRIGANIMGKRMFEEGAASWPENAPFHNQVFVLTHEKRKPWERPGGTTFHFVNEGIHDALRRARDAAGRKDVRISGGAETVVQYLNAGLVEELAIDVAPVLLGEGLRLLDGVDPAKVHLTVEEAVHSPRVTHLRYRVHSKNGGDIE